MIRDFYDSNYCKIKWEETYLNGFRTIPSAAMLDGLVFEQNVIGMSRGGEVYEKIIKRIKNNKRNIIKRIKTKN